MLPSLVSNVDKDIKNVPANCDLCQQKVHNPTKSDLYQWKLPILNKVFSHFKQPEQIVSEYGPPFGSNDFAVFCKSNSIDHSRSARYHPQSNDEAKSFVKTFHDAFKSSAADAASAKRLGSEFHLRYRVSSHGTAGSSPSQVLIGRVPRTKLHFLHPDVKIRVRVWQESDEIGFNLTAETREFALGDPVFFRIYIGQYL